MGMIKLPSESINFFKHHVDDIFESGNFAEGKWNQNIVSFIKEMTGAKHALATNSNGSGSVALMSLYRNKFNRNKVILQSNTMYGVKAWIEASGCSLGGYIDCSTETLMPTYNDVYKFINNLSTRDKNGSMIILTHIGGIINPDIDQIAIYCKKEGVILIEDCAHSLGSTYKNKHSGLFGDAGVYSFYATKAIPAGEGGIVVTNDEEIGYMVQKFSMYDRFDQKLNIGNNIRISEFQALLTFSALKEWEKILKNKFGIAKYFIEACEDLNIHYISQENDGQSGNYYKFIILSNSGSIDDDFPKLKTKTSPVYDYALGENIEITTCHACLPIWYGQDDKTTEKVVDELKSHF